MSWTKRRQLARELDREIAKGTATLREIMDFECLVTCARQESPRLARFLEKNVRELIDFVANKDTENLKYQKIATDLLTHLHVLSSVRKALFGNPENLAYLLDKMREDGNDTAMCLYVLSRNIEDSDTAALLMHIPEPAEFFKFVISRIADSHFFELAHTILATQTNSSRIFMVNACVYETLMSELRATDSDAIRVKILDLLGLLLAFAQRQPDLLQKLEDIKTVTTVLELGLESHCVRVSEASFRIIIALCNMSDDRKSTKPDTESAFDIIMNYLEENCHQLAVFIQRDYTFASDKRYAMELVTSVVSTKDAAPPAIFTLASFLLNLFFEQKTNSFLHRAFFSLFQALSILKSGFVEFIAETNIFTEILDCFDRRNDIAASYWGTLHEIAGILNNPDLAKLCPDPARWREYIANVYTSESRVMQAPYGGPRPSDNTDLAYLCRLADSQDLLSAFAKSSSSSSSDTSSSDDGPIYSSSNEEESSGDEGPVINYSSSDEA